jgi:hypothetical protein
LRRETDGRNVPVERRLRQRLLHQRGQRQDLCPALRCERRMPERAVLRESVQGVPS